GAVRRRHQIEGRGQSIGGNLEVDGHLGRRRAHHDGAEHEDGEERTDKLHCSGSSSSRDGWGKIPHGLRSTEANIGEAATVRKRVVANKKVPITSRSGAGAEPEDLYGSRGLVTPRATPQLPRRGRRRWPCARRCAAGRSG